MRETKYRGVREKTGEWVYGYLVEREEPYLHDIVFPIGNTSSVTYAVKRESVGQYTGLKDINGVEIYEGDIVRYDHTVHPLRLILFDDGGYSYKIPGCDTPHCFRRITSGIACLDMKVVGNVYDNPELLEEGLSEV